MKLFEKIYNKSLREDKDSKYTVEYSDGGFSVDTFDTDDFEEAKAKYDEWMEEENESWEIEINIWDNETNKIIDMEDDNE